MNNDILELLKRIQLKPGIYIGEKSITRLRSFIDGYICACRDFNIAMTSENYYTFRNYLEKKYNVKKSVLWDVFLMEETHDEKSAFDLFFHELKLFESGYAKNTNDQDHEMR